MISMATNDSSKHAQMYNYIRYIIASLPQPVVEALTKWLILPQQPLHCMWVNNTQVTNRQRNSTTVTNLQQYL